MEEIHLVKCENCNEKFYSIESVQDYIKHVHKVEACMHCNRRFTSKETMEKYIKDKHMVRCKNCNEEFYSIDSMQDHMEEQHVLQACDMCGNKCLTEVHLETHPENIYATKDFMLKSFRSQN